MDKIIKTNEEWKKDLDPKTYQVTREGGTEPAFNNEYWDHHEKGMYKCSNCGLVLFSSDKKFDSGTGWPSFYEAEKGTVEFVDDDTHGMRRTEAVCARCGAHLGHIFHDAPQTPTGARLCMNSCSLSFEKDGTESAAK